ncbi:hypothetical protein ACS6IV_13755, partial [Enterobacter hormaechei subsp. xiangfangensis]|uniref:hypothetical protein n=1 Tax=Enterobacter hormaechei TaxID=158836 RepID=UPI003F421573
MEEKSYRADQNHTKKPAAYGWLFVSEAWGTFYIAGQSSSNARLMKNVTLPNTSTSSRAVP